MKWATKGIRASAFVGCMLLVGCASYRPAPLHTGANALAEPVASILSADGSALRRPFLTPATIDLSRPLDLNTDAAIAVVANPNLKALRTRSGVIAEITRPSEIALRAVSGVTQIRSTTSRGATAVPRPIEVKLFSSDPKVLAGAARTVATRLEKITGAVEVVDGLRVSGDAVSVKVLPGAAAQQRLDPASVAAQLEALIGRKA